ncbi:MAG: phosphotransferase, partial [Burkholderiales bacterium]|nr:phosphotransferase [Anaerolineae bacterium]
EKFMTQAQCLIHGDLHTGSIMVNQTETYVIDPEFAFYGPMAFDIGAVIANLFLSYASHEVRSKDPDQRADFRQYLTDTIIDVWQVFKREFQPILEQTDSVNMPHGYRSGYTLRLLQDVAGFAGCKMMRRVIGLAGVEDIRGIEDVHERAIAGSLALNMAHALIMKRGYFYSMDDIVGIATAARPTYPWP